MTDTALERLIGSYGLEQQVLVTRPSLPSLERFHECLRQIWDSGWLTNGGAFHVRFESALKSFLDVEQVSLFCNGTVALLVAFEALGITDGEVITTPFTFPATPHVVHWNGVTPVFCDIDPQSYNIDPAKIERLVTPRTRAILPVHVFGYPCDVEAIRAIADKHGLPVVYDAAHAFGVRVGGRSIAGWGDLTMLSFHATKLFSSIEGGALVSRTEKQKQTIDFLKNFGIADEQTVIGPGINGKMNELQAAYGLLQIEMIQAEIEKRRHIVAAYRRRLSDVPGLTMQADVPGVSHNYAYFSVLVESEKFGMDRDELHATLKLFNVFTRRYFYPLCSQIPFYSGLPTAASENLPVAEQVARRVLCLPIYGSLELDTVEKIAEILARLQQYASVG